MAQTGAISSIVSLGNWVGTLADLNNVDAAGLVSPLAPVNQECRVQTVALPHTVGVDSGWGVTVVYDKEDQNGKQIDFYFKWFAPGSGVQLGSTITRTNVTTANETLVIPDAVIAALPGNGVSKQIDVVCGCNQIG